VSMALRMCGTGEVIGMIRVKVFLEMFLFGENKPEVVFLLFC